MGGSEALVSYVGDHQGYAEVYAPEGAKIAAREAAGSGSSEEQALDPTHRDVTLEVEASPPDEVSGVIEPPPDSQRSGPYLVTLNSSRGASERVVVAEPNICLSAALRPKRGNHCCRSRDRRHRQL